MEIRKILILAIAVICVGFLVGAGLYNRYYHRIEKAPALQIDTQGMPTIGNPGAKIQIVVFEDFKCPHCAEFSIEVFPKIRDQYVNTGIASYTLIPVAFIPGSKPIANAALEVYATTPELFFPFADALFSNSPKNEDELIRIAGQIEGIDLERVKSCIKAACHDQELEKNLRLIERIMGNDDATPSLYINGAETPTSFHSIQTKINELQGKKL